MVVFDLLSQKTFAETPDFLSEGSSLEQEWDNATITVTHPPFPEQDQNLHHTPNFIKYLLPHQIFRFRTTQPQTIRCSHNPKKISQNSHF